MTMREVVRNKESCTACWPAGDASGIGFCDDCRAVQSRSPAGCRSLRSWRAPSTRFASESLLSRPVVPEPESGVLLSVVVVEPLQRCPGPRPRLDSRCRTPGRWPVPDPSLKPRVAGRSPRRSIEPCMPCKDFQTATSKESSPMMWQRHLLVVSPRAQSKRKSCALAHAREPS
jgi:hypothetical protein